MTPDPSQGQPSPNRRLHAETGQPPPPFELTLPPTDPDLANIYALTHNASPEEALALGEILDTLSDSHSTKSNSRLSYLGDRLAKHLTPLTAPIALQGMRSQSLSFIGSFLAALAKGEFLRSADGLPPLTQGIEYAQLRVAIAHVAVAPEKMFRERDWRTNRNEIEKVAYLPLTILRRSASEEIDAVAVDGLTAAGLFPTLNRNAAELLSSRESSHPNRVLSEDVVLRLLPILSDCLRDDLTRSLLSTVIDRWLAKGFRALGEAERATKRRAIDECKDFLAGRFVQPPIGAPQTFDFLTLLRHFRDNESRSVLRELSAHSDIGAALLAQSCLEDSPETQVATLTEYLEKQQEPSAKFGPLRCFGYQLSEQADLRLAAHIKRYAEEMWKRKTVPHYRYSQLDPDKQALVQALRRRFHTEPTTSPMVAMILGPRGSENPGLASLALLVLQQSAKASAIPPLCMYEHKPTLRRVAELISLARQDDPLLATELFPAFFLDGPARYGFEVNA